MSLDRPRFRRDLEAVPFEADGQVFVEVRDPRTGDAFQFYEFEYRVALAFDGLPFERVIPWLKLATGMQFQRHQLRDFAQRLDELGFLEPGATDAQTADAGESDDGEPEPADEAWADAKTVEIAGVVTELGSDAPRSLSQALEQAVEVGPQSLDEPATEPSAIPQVDESTPPGETEEGMGVDAEAETPAPEDMLAEQADAGDAVESRATPEPELEPEPEPEPATAVEEDEPVASVEPVEGAEEETAEIVATVEGETEQEPAQAETGEAAEELVSAPATVASASRPMVAYQEEESAAPENEPACEPTDEPAAEAEEQAGIGEAVYEPVAEAEEPAEIGEPTAEAEEPAAEADESAGIGELTEEPVAEAEEPVAEADEPVAEADESAGIGELTEEPVADEPVAEAEEQAGIGEAVYEPAAEAEEQAGIGEAVYEPAAEAEEPAAEEVEGKSHSDPDVADEPLAAVEPSVPPEDSCPEDAAAQEREAVPQPWPRSTSVSEAIANAASARAAHAAPFEQPAAAIPEAAEEPTVEPEAQVPAPQAEVEARAEWDASAAASEEFEPEHPPVMAEASPSVEEQAREAEPTPVAEAGQAAEAPPTSEASVAEPAEALSGEQPATEVAASPVVDAVATGPAKRPSGEEPVTAVDASFVVAAMAEGSTDSSETDEPTTEVEAPLAAVAELAASLPAPPDETAEEEESSAAETGAIPAEVQTAEEAGVRPSGPHPSAGAEPAGGMARHLDSSAFPVLPTPPPQTVSPGPPPSKSPPVKANPQAFVTPRPATLGPLMAAQQAAVRKQQRRSLLLFGSLGVIAAVAVLAVLVPFFLSGREPAQVEVRTLVVSPGTLFRYFPGAGIVTALPGEVLKFPAGGRVTRIVKPGTKVAVGDVLAAVDPSHPLLKQLAQQRERLAYYQQMVDAMRQVGNKDEEERHAANVAARKAKIAKTLRALSHVAVVARAPGEVEESFAREGDTVEAGSLALRMRSGGHRAVFEMPRSQAAEARRLGLCQVGVDSLVLDCTQIQERGDDTHVTVDIKALPPVLMGRPARLARARFDGSVALPRAAILGTGRRLHVLLVSPLGRIETRPVTLVEQNVAEAIVIQGLDPGDSVVIDPTSELRPGMHASVKS